MIGQSQSLCSQNRESQKTDNHRRVINTNKFLRVIFQACRESYEKNMNPFHDWSFSCIIAVCVNAQKQYLIMIPSNIQIFGGLYLFTNIIRYYCLTGPLDPVQLSNNAVVLLSKQSPCSKVVQLGCSPRAPDQMYDN